MVWRKLSLARIVGQIPIGVAVTRPDGRIDYANPYFEALLGAHAGALLGCKLDAFRLADGMGSRAAGVEHALRRERRQAEACFRCGVGGTVHVQETVYPIPDGEAAPTCFIHFLKDLSAHKRVETLSTLAFYDALTGLPNRNLFEDRLAQAVASAERRGGFALLYIDIDRFKDINDTWGHPTGDRALREAAARMSRALRKSDTLARLGGDEFAAILGGVTDHADACAITEKLLDCCAEHLSVDGVSLRLTLSVGIGLYPRDGRDPATLLKHADWAMYRAKAQGRNRCCSVENLRGSRLEAAGMARGVNSA